LLHQLKHYIRHCFKSFHLHGIHSPFVFALEKECLKDKSIYEQYNEMIRFRESLKNNHSTLNIEDYGAGSKVFKSNERKVSDILKHNCSDKKSTRILWRLCRYFKVRNVLEFGTSLGIATHAMALASDEIHITSIEGSPEIQKFAVDRFNNLSIKNIKSICSTFKEFLTQEKKNIYDLIYIDGHHDGIATIKYFEDCLKHSHKDTVFVLDDIYWSTSMTMAWDQLCNHPKVTASVDLFDMGLLFLREEQLQERFYINL